MVVTSTPPRKNVNHGTTAPPTPKPTGPHISEPIRADLGKLDPKLAAGVRRVADSK